MLVLEVLRLRRKDVLITFRDIFSNFMVSHGYKFYKNCFIKYCNNVFNRVSIFTQKTIDLVSFDIIHYCSPIYIELFNIEADNEDDNFSLARIACADNIINDIEWNYEYGNTYDMVSKIQNAFDVYLKYFQNFDCECIDDYNAKLKKYNQKLRDSSEPEIYISLLDLFTGEMPISSVPQANQNKLKELIIDARFESYYIIERLNEMSNGYDQSNIEIISDSLSSFNENIQYAKALFCNDKEFLQQRQAQEDSERKEIIEKNKKLLYAAGLIVE